MFWIEEAARLGDENLEEVSVVAFLREFGLAALIRPQPTERICRDLATYLRQPAPDLAMSEAARRVPWREVTVRNHS